MKVVEVTQFFEYKGMKWSDLVKTKDKPVLLTEDKKHCLWKEDANVKEVDDNEHPPWGDVWLIEGKNGEVELYKANYDSSD